MRDKEKLKIYRANWIRKNPERWREICRYHRKATYKRRKSAHRAKCAEWVRKNPEKMRAYRKKWAVRNRELLRMYCNARRHTQRALGKISSRIIQMVYEDNIKRFGTLTCVLCYQLIQFGQDSLEHLVPISRGGTNDYSNLGVSHRKCNSAKYNMTLEEFFNRRGMDSYNHQDRALTARKKGDESHGR